jgi:hypothetical protein
MENEKPKTMKEAQASIPDGISDWIKGVWTAIASRKKAFWLMEVLRPVATVPSHFSEEVPYKPNASNCKYTKIRHSLPPQALRQKNGNIGKRGRTGYEHGQINPKSN